MNVLNLQGIMNILLASSDDIMGDMEETATIYESELNSFLGVLLEYSCKDKLKDNHLICQECPLCFL